MKVLKVVLAILMVGSAALPHASAQEKKKGAAKTAEVQQPQPAATAAAPDEPTKVMAQSLYTERGEYLLGLSDVLQLKVYGEPQFDGDLDVEEDGTISLPFADGPIQAKCRKVNAVRKDVITALSSILRNPKVDLRVKERKSRQPAVVYGAVRTPQQYTMQRRARLLELLSNSGGVTEQHSGTIQIIHTEPVMCEEEERAEAGPTTVATAASLRTGEDALGLPFELYSVSDLKQGRPEANPYIRNGDIVYVAEALPIYIVGNVAQPNNLYLKEGMTLTRALATVGGPREANESKVKIYRLNQRTMKQEELIVDYKAIKANKAKDIVLQPYDIIEVPKRGFNAKSVAEMVLGMARSSVSTFGTNLPMRVLY